MKEYLVNFWTSNHKYSGARICAESGGQAMDIVKNSYNIDHVVNWEPVENYSTPSPARFVTNNFNNEYNYTYNNFNNEYNLTDNYCECCDEFNDYGL